MSIVIAPLITESGGLVIGPLFVPDDTDAAQFTAGPSVSLITQTGFRVGFTVGEAATVYGIVVAQGSAVPTPEQIIAGVDYGAVTVLDSQQVGVSAGVANYLTFADIVGQAGNNVRAYLTAVDTAGNIQAQGDILTALAQLLPAVTPDTTPPVITLAGANPMRLVVGQEYVEPGYSAVDNVDGPIAQDAAGWTVTSTVNINAVGSYSVTYQVEDAAGNVGTETRIVNVEQSAVLAAYPIKRTVTWDDGQTPELVIGDTFQHLITLNSAGLAFDVSGASSIQACIASKDHATQYSAAVEMASDATGADWSTGDVIIYMTGEQTADIADYVTAEGLAKIEIQVEIGADKFSWFGAVRLVPGFIS